VSETNAGDDVQTTALPAPTATNVPSELGTDALVRGQAGSLNDQEFGKIRSTGVCILLAIVTLGIYPIVWYYMVHDEMKRHSNDGLGGGVALILAILVGFVMPYVTSSEVGALYARRGIKKPVSGTTGLWYFPGSLILVGPLIWFIKTNGALNTYWRSLGAH
jgi:Domain of unknown function (DUF4234)/Cytochrome b(C-terminal)/b6/petD